MVKKRRAAEFKNEIHVLVGSDIRDPFTHELAAEFTKSSQKFLDRLQFLGQKLEGQFERYSDDGGLTSRRRWNPPEYFNYCGFASLAGKIYEAWNVARRLNSQLDAFSGELVRALVLLFEQMRTEEIKKSGVPAPAELSVSCFRFKCEVDRFELLLSLHKRDAWTPTEKQIRQVKEAIAGMKYKTTNLEAIRIAAKMNKQRVSIILKMIGHQAE